ncbi:MAG TPA: ribosome biogenesis GTPase Der [Candidatus Limnocylindria bacterium]|nr:ribosome biogenesis GTPase Der [Candidatus Limnocylindria bacterium]
MARAVVAIVGRPNVGKSTLFNRLVGERVAIVEDEPGTTRDRIYATSEWRGREFSLIDTGGLDDPRAGEMEAAVRRQAEAAITEADVVLFIVDAQSGVLPVEHDVADLLRRSGKSVLLVANKADSWRGEAQAAEFYELGLGDPLTVSAVQGIGTGDLLDAVVERLPPPVAHEETTDARVAIVGRPNVGKSSFLNMLVGAERAVVSEIPGTTRDSVDTLLELPSGRRVVLVDTAGIRRRGRIEEGIEKYALLRTATVLERADVAILLTDATEGLTAQDVHIAGYALESRVGLVLAVNKWDVVDRGPEMTASVEADIAREFHFVPWMGHRFVSAKTGRNVHETLTDALGIVDERAKRVPTADLHRMLVEVVAAHPPAPYRGREVRFRHVTQARGKAPTFVFFVDPPEGVHFTYRRYLENAIRGRFGFTGTPITIEFKGAHE